MKQLSLIAAFFLLSIVVQAQSVSLHKDDTEPYEGVVNRVGTDFHSDVRPWSLSELQKQSEYDSVTTHFWPLRPSERDSNERFISLAPVLDLGAGADLASSSSNTFLPNLGLGVRASGRLAKNLNFSVDAMYKLATYPDYIDSLAEERFILPGEGWATPQGNGYSTQQLSAYLSWDVDDWLNLQVGHGRNFFGDGYRSLFLSDNTYSYPHFKITTDIWKIKYVNLFTMLGNTVQSGGSRSGITRRYASMHYLTWNATRRLNISLFEAVLWQGQDQGVNRGFEFNYLNPVIFYRPVEFSVGSSDNAIIGLGWKVRISDNDFVYGQLLLDEFVFDFIREDLRQFYQRGDTVRNGWWANKYAIQLGWRSDQLFGKENLSFRTELNWVRPFTYTHGTLSQNYTHFGQPLAHPLGANFFEWVNIFTWRKGRLTIQEQFNRSVYGTNPSALDNYGGDLFVPYNNRVREFENFTGQGIQHFLTFNNLRATWLVNSAWNLRLDGGYIFRNVKSDFSSQNTHWFYVGVRTSLFNRYHDF